MRHGDYADPREYAPERRQLLVMTVKQYVASLLAAAVSVQPPAYAGNFTLPSTFLATLGGSQPVYYTADRFEPPTVWLGGAGSITPLYRDSSDNFAVQLVGSKRWTIFPPQDAPFLYMTWVKASPGGDFATSAIDLRAPDLVRFPLLSKAHPIALELNAGEVLYLPMGWSHYVVNLELSLMVNHWLSINPTGIAALDGGP